jgi:hypothetical protein
VSLTENNLFFRQITRMSVNSGGTLRNFSRQRREKNVASDFTTITLERGRENGTKGREKEN